MSGHRFDMYCERRADGKNEKIDEIARFGQFTIAIDQFHSIKIYNNSILIEYRIVFAGFFSPPISLYFEMLGRNRQWEMA